MRFYRSLDDLPNPLPLFPLPGVLLLPRGQLPLNVFEPRYLAMVDIAMSGARIIGMIQPTQTEEQALKPTLSQVGCAGRITGYQETDDGRYLITLTGVCRFRVVEELASDTAYRMARVDYAPFAGDLAMTAESDLPRERLLGALKDYLSQRDMKADWQSVMTAPPEMLVNSLAMMCPFEPAEKQALLEAQSWQERVATLIALLEMGVGPTGSGGNTVN